MVRDKWREGAVGSGGGGCGDVLLRWVKRRGARLVEESGMGEEEAEKSREGGVSGLLVIVDVKKLRAGK